VITYSYLRHITNSDIKMKNWLPCYSATKCGDIIHCLKTQRINGTITIFMHGTAILIMHGIDILIVLLEEYCTSL
jgi:hypothetical protein